MDKKQLTDLIMIPLLKQIPSGYTIKARIAVQMIIAHESERGEYIRQLGGGPAMGWIQMERTTYFSTWAHGDSIWRNAKKVGIINDKEYKKRIVPDVNRLLYDMRFNIFMCRQRLFMKPAALPEGLVDISIYLKKHWNTATGSASDNSYLDALLLWK